MLSDAMNTLALLVMAFVLGLLVREIIELSGGDPDGFA
jgi:hypothetical protein